MYIYIYLCIHIQINIHKYISPSQEALERAEAAALRCSRTRVSHKDRSTSSPSDQSAFLPKGQSAATDSPLLPQAEVPRDQSTAITRQMSTAKLSLISSPGTPIQVVASTDVENAIDLLNWQTPQMDDSYSEALHSNVRRSSGVEPRWFSYSLSLALSGEEVREKVRECIEKSMNVEAVDVRKVSRITVYMY